MNREAKESEELRRNDPLEIPVSEECNSSEETVFESKEKDRK